MPSVHPRCRVVLCAGEALDSVVTSVVSQICCAYSRRLKWSLIWPLATTPDAPDLMKASVKKMLKKGPRGFVARRPESCNMFVSHTDNYRK